MISAPGRQWSIATGYGALVCGVGAAALERPWPTDPTGHSLGVTAPHAVGPGRES